MAKRTIIDLIKAFEILKSRGIKYNQSMVVEQFKVTAPTINLWQKQAPETVVCMQYCIKESKREFPDILKKIRANNDFKDKPLDFIMAFCNSTGLTFKEVVREV